MEQVGIVYQYDFCVLPSLNFAVVIDTQNSALNAKVRLLVTPS